MTCPPSQGSIEDDPRREVEGPFSPEIVHLAEAGALDGFLLPDELQELCRAVLDHVGRIASGRT